MGAGPFPSELHDEMGETIRQRGGEFGTTTGRPRRTGWLDLVALRYAARLNTLTALVITKLDVLSGLDRIQVCTSYRGAEGAEFEDFPYHQTVLHHTTARADRAAGWKEDLGECRTMSDLPEGAREYLRIHRGAHRRARDADRRRARSRAGGLDRGRPSVGDRPGRKRLGRGLDAFTHLFFGAASGDLATNRAALLRRARHGEPARRRTGGGPSKFVRW